MSNFTRHLGRTSSNEALPVPPTPPNNQATQGPQSMRSSVNRGANLVVQVGLCCAIGTASAQTFNDQLLFTTSNQSLWGSGTASGWQFDSGLLGGSWGGSTPVNLGANGIVGSVNGVITPEIPGYTIPGVDAKLLTSYVAPKQLTPYIPSKQLTPAIPATYITVKAVKVLGKTIVPAYKKQVTPYIAATYSSPVPATYSAAIPATYSPAVASIKVPSVPAVYGDTRTGSNVAIKTSGEMGLKVTAAATAGAVQVTLPVLATLNMPTTFASGQSVHISGTTTINNGAKIEVSATGFKADVNGIIKTNSEIGITGCVLGTGCTSVSAKPEIDTNISLVSLNTATTPMATVLGQAVSSDKYTTVPITVGGQVVGDVALTLPKNQSGGTVNGQVVSLDTHQSVVKVSADLAQIADNGDIPLPSAEVNLGVASASADSLYMKGGVDLGMSQSLSFDANVMVTLSFDQMVTMSIGATTYAASKTVTFDLDDGADLVFQGQAGRLVSRTFSMGANSLLTNRTSISVDPFLDIQGGCFSMSVPTVVNSSDCVMSQNLRTTDLVSETVYDESFALKGFNTVTFTTAVPEPETWAMLMAGLSLMGTVARRRRSSTHFIV